MHIYLELIRERKKKWNKFFLFMNLSGFNMVLNHKSKFYGMEISLSALTEYTILFIILL